MNSAGLVALDADPTPALVALDERYQAKLSLARVLRSAIAKGRLEPLARESAPTPEAWEASPFADPTLRGLWRDASDLTSLLLRIDPTRLREACEQLLGGASAAHFALPLLFGAEGILPRARRESAFFRERVGCLEDPSPERIHGLVRGTAVFVEDLCRGFRDFRRLLRELRTRSRAPLVLHTYGWGEISRTVGLVRRSSAFASGLAPASLVYKRMPAFVSREAAEHYVGVYEDYNRRLRDEVGIAVPEFGHRIVVGERGRPVVLVTQARLDPSSIGKQLLLRRDAEQCQVLFRMVLGEYRKLARYNRAQAEEGLVMGLDGQIPNWAVREYRGDGVPLRGDEGLIYVDTNTPMMRRRGRECLPMGFYLRGLPAIIRPVLRPMAKKVLDRYFDLRTILLDFLANTAIHGRGELIEAFLPEGNAFLAEGLIEPVPRGITAADVQSYIRSDVATWRLMRSARKVQEMLQAKRGPVQTAKQIYGIYTSPLF